MDLAELLTMETSVLRTLCLTVNSEDSELKTRITESLIVDDFYFPITKSVYAVISDLTNDGTNVDSASLEQALTQRSVDVPDDFFLEDLFTGEAPTLELLSRWIDGLKPREAPHASSAPSARSAQAAPAAPAAGAPTNGNAKLAVTHPSVTAKGGEETPKASTPSHPPPAAMAASPAVAAPEAPQPATRQEPAAPRRKRNPKAKTKTKTKAAAQARPSEPTKMPAAPAESSPSEVLAPESGEWLGYLAELTKKQGEHLKTGFSELDAEWGGLGPGLLLLAGLERMRLLDFLKQLVDQIATRCRVPCLFLSFERSKAELRLATLSRLSGAAAAHIQDGRFDKDSAEWQSIIRAGEHAVEWLQRIYVVEPTAGLAVTAIREMRQGLIDSGAGATCMIAVDNLQKLASKSDLLQSVAELKELAESLGIVVIGVAENVELVHERSADMAVTFTEQDDVSTLEVHTPASPDPTVLRFDYRRETHAFEERL